MAHEERWRFVRLRLVALLVSLLCMAYRLTENVACDGRCGGGL